MTTLQKAIAQVNTRAANEAARKKAANEAAIRSITPTITALKSAFGADLMSWDTIKAAEGSAWWRGWCEGKYGSVFLCVESSEPERVRVFRSAHGEAPVSFIGSPLIEGGIDAIALAIAERITLAHASEWTTVSAL